jgi:5'-nucleotidase
MTATILVTNDDGIESPGLHELAAMAFETGHRVIVAAPARESSGSSASITGASPEGNITMDRHPIAALPDVRSYAVQAAPALIALIAAHGAFGDPPDLVLSGVNRGANVGHAILHSGTLGAALTAGSSSGRGLAVSLDVGMDPPECHWKSAAATARHLLGPLLDGPTGVVLNLNVPNTADPGPGRVRLAKLAPFGIVQTTAAEQGDDALRLTVADLESEQDPDTDAALLLAGHSTLTRVTGIGEAQLDGRYDGLVD